MSGEQWITPVELGVVAVGTTDWNNIQKNLSVLHRGNGLGTIQTAVAANNMNLPNEYDDCFYVSGPTSINTISISNRQLSNTIKLIKITEGCQVNNGQAPSEGYLPIYIYNAGLLEPGLGNFIWLANVVITLTRSATAWHCTV